MQAVLPEILLDDVRFQELVSEARTRIVRHSPDWTEHNVSDPGITLIELFAWFTEILVYRINRIPERLHLGLLDLVGVRPGPPECATVEVRFVLEQPGSGARIPAGTEVASPRTAGSDSVVFQTVGELVIPAGRLAAYAVQRAGHVEAGTMAGDTAQPTGQQQAPFGSPPGVDDALLLGFDLPIAGLVIRAVIESSRAEGSEIDSADPPLAWEASGSDGDWHEATIIADETGGFLLGGGAVTLELPPDAGSTEIAGQKLHWLRCRVTGRTRRGRRAGYRRAPEITSVSAVVAGATAPARHAATVRGELLGTSDGIAGAVYPLQRRPVLRPEDGETLEVRVPGDTGWVPWREVDSFALSNHSDRHFLLDRVRGEVRFGPAIRQPDGGWRRYGAVPPAGASLRFNRYRHGGGSAGNVAPRALTILSQPIPGIASVTNPRAAAGGVEAESLDGARERARLEVRARSRAVTAEDFERLTLAASPRVARAVCVAPDSAGPVRVHVLPRVNPADRLLEFNELVPDAELLRTVAAQLDERRLLGTSIRLLPVRLRGVSVVADVRASPLADLERVQQDVSHALYVYLNPLIGGSPGGPASGWPIGRALNQGELFGIVYGIDGVEFVNILRMYETDIRTGEQAPQPTESHLVLEPDELIASGRHIVKAIYRE
jgi:predicted phage baseplate assembly protein